MSINNVVSVTNRTHYVIRVNDGENLRNGVNPYWGVTRDAGQKSKVEKMNHGDVLWFITSKQFGGKVIGMAEYVGCSDRKEDVGFKSHLISNKEQGWVGDKEWDILIHYDKLYNTEHYEIGACIKCSGNILSYERFKENITKNLYEIYENKKIATSLSALTSVSFDYEGEEDEDDVEIRKMEQMLQEKKQKKQEKMRKKHYDEWVKNSQQDVSDELSRQRQMVNDFCVKNGIMSPDSLFSDSPKITQELLQTIYAKKYPIVIAEPISELYPSNPSTTHVLTVEPLSANKSDMKRPMSLGECFKRNTFIHHNKCDVYAEYDANDGFLHLCEKDQSTGVIRRTVPSQTWQTLNRFTVRNYEEKIKREGKSRTVCNNAYLECLYENDKGEWVSCHVLYSGFILTNPRKNV